MLHESYLETGPTRLNVARNRISKGLSKGVTDGVAARPLLLLHGVLREWHDFVSILPPLATTFALHALDFRGHGRSGLLTGSYRVVDYVEDALALLEACQAPVWIYGHSLGAMVAAMTAARRPDRVTGLILEDPPFHAMGNRLDETRLGSLFRAMQRCLGESQSTHELTLGLAELQLQGPGDASPVRLGDTRDIASLRYSAACLRKIDAAVLDQIVDGQWLAGYDLEQLGEIQCPTLLMQADPLAGGMLSNDDAGWFAETVRNCYHLKIRDAGHLIHWTHRETLLNATLNFTMG